jgi:hypothetical protein
MSKVDEVFFLPPMAVARLGGSDIPLASFTWVEDPSLHGAGKTVIAPARSLEVLANGSVRPFHPATVHLRDGNLLRPVAPFFELWVRGDAGEHALTAAWLKANRGSLDKITYTVTAANKKAARRCGVPSCAFSATVRVRGNDHRKYPLLASSPKLPSGEDGLVLPNSPIPLGHFQVIKPVPGAAMDVDLNVLRVRFTPARGEVYGPRDMQAKAKEADADTRHELHTLVPEGNRSLNQNASWVQYSSRSRRDNPEPPDTYDGADDRSRQEQSFGVVDDTCDVVMQATIVIARKSFVATARVFSAPPDFAPDRRPFYSLADELIDRDPPPREPLEPIQDAVIRLGDLFQRVYETASLANVDMMRSAIMPPEGSGPRNFAGMPAVTVPASMTRDDHLFDRDDDLNSAASAREKLPYSSVAGQVHAPMADADDLAQTLREKGGFVKKLIRPAYAHFKNLAPKVNSEDKPNPEQRDPRNNRDQQPDMRMPPYMLDSDATPLSLNRRQYEFLLQTLERLQPSRDRGALAAGAAPPDFNLAHDHVMRVVKRLSGKARNPDGAKGNKLAGKKHSAQSGKHNGR